MKKYLLFYLVFSSVFLFHYFVSGQAVYGDGIDYWAYAHTWFFDHNLDQNNEFRHIFSVANNNSAREALSPQPMKTGITPLGKTDNIHPAGTAVFYLPFYVLADLVASPKNGYSHAYQVIVGLGVVFYVTLSAFLTEKLLLKITANPRVSWLTTITIFGASSLLYYGSYDILNSHFASYLLSISFWYVFFVADFTRPKTWFCTGLIVALAAAVRVQDILLFLPLLLKFNKLKYLFISIVTFLIAYSPQFYIWNYFYGTALPYTYIANLDASVVNHYDFLGSLFHPVNGLLRTPVVFLSIFGLSSSLLLPFLSFVLPTFALITYQNGWVAASYGGRMYISTLPLFAVLLANFFTRLKPRYSISISSILIIINIFSIAGFVFFEKEALTGDRRGLEESTRIKINHYLNYIKISL